MIHHINDNFIQIQRLKNIQRHIKMDYIRFEIFSFIYLPYKYCLVILKETAILNSACISK